MSRRAYPQYKSSVVEWLGGIPKHWVVSPLRRLSRIRYGLGQPPNEAADGLPLLRVTNVKRGKISAEGLVFVEPSDVPASRDAFLRENEIIVVRSGAYTGDSALVTRDYAGAVAGYDMVATIRVGVPAYFAWQLLGPEVCHYQFQLVRLRAAQPHMNAEELGDTIVVSPPNAEQQVIAAFLDRETERVDSLIAKKQRQIELLQEKRAALISHAVTKGLDPNVKTKDSGIEWLGQIPEHWQLTRLKFLATNTNGAGIQIGPFGGMLKDVTYDDEGEFKVYGQENTLSGDFSRGNRWIAKAQFAEMQHYHIHPGDIVFTRKGSIGGCSLVSSDVRKGIIDSDTIRLRVVQERVSAVFILYAFKYSVFLQGQVQETKRGAILSGLNTSTIANLLFLIPPLPEQVSIVSHIEQRIGQVDALLTKVEASIQMMREYRTALISAAVTGKIDVRKGAAQ